MPTHGVRILIGEDEEIVALDIAEQLLALGYEVERRTGTPTEVIALARELTPDVIVLDLNITGDLHGLEVARQLHSVAHIPIVFMSAFDKDIRDNDPSIPRSYRYVTKPFSVARLQAAIQDLVDKRASSRVSL